MMAYGMLIHNQHMAVNGGYGADKYDISREAQDEVGAT